MCVPPHPPMMTQFGFEAVVTHDHSNPNEMFAFFISAICMITFAWRAAYSQRALNTVGVNSDIRWLMFWYALGTGLFAVVLAVFDTGRVLLVFAAFHNMMEWGLIAYLWTHTSKVNQRVRMAIAWIYLVIVVTLFLPTLKLAVAFEQLTGIICDYILVGTFLLKRYYPDPADPEGTNQLLRPLWDAGLKASLLHFGQIWPLVVGTWHVSFIPNWLLLIILILSTLPTFYFYTEFSLAWDEIEKHLKKNDRERDIEKGKGVNYADRSPGTPFVVYTSDLSTKRWWIVFVVSGLCGAATIFGQALIPTCKA